MPGRPGKTPGMLNGMLSGTVKDKPSGMVKGTLPKSRGDAPGRVAAAGPRPAAGPLAAPGCGASSTMLLSTSIVVPAPLGAFGEATGANPLPKELPPSVRWMTAVASVRSPFPSSIEHLYTIHSDGRIHPEEFLSSKRGWLLRRIARGPLSRQNEIGCHHMVAG